MTSVTEHFFYLDSESKRVSGSQLLTRGTGLEVAGHEVLAAVDSTHHKHLLIPLADDEVKPDSASQGVILSTRILRVGDTSITYVDLHCRISKLDRVFQELVADVLNQLAKDSAEPATTCRKVLDDWRALLRASGQAVSRETIVGLVGELEVLRLLAGSDPLRALDSWQGPSRTVHDFVWEEEELEVKTTTSVDANFVAISNIDQLDPALVGSLHLLVVHAREDPRAPGLDERIDGLVTLGIPTAALLAKVSSAGYLYGTGTTLGDRFAVRSVRAWKVGPSFPGLRRNELSETRMKGVSKLRYELALDSAPERLTDDAFDHLLATWGRD